MGNYTKLNSKNIINYHVANDIGTFVAKHLSFIEMEALQNKYASLLAEYQNTPELNILSTIKMDKLTAFKEWVPEALTHYNQVIPFLVSNMFKGDILSLNMFENIHKAAGKDELLITYTKIHNDDNLKSVFSGYGGAEDARAIMTAEHWLESTEAANMFKGSDELTNNDSFIQHN
jgi:hypothetical protein